MARVSRVLDARFIRTLMACALLTGCAAAADSPTDPEDPLDDPDRQTALTDVQRITALEAVADRIPALAGADADSRRAELLAWLGSRREFEASGANEDGSLWARFTDGRLLLIIANRDEAIAPEADAAPAPGGTSVVDGAPGGGGAEAGGAVFAIAPGPPAELPASIQARFLSGGEPPGSPTIVPKLQAMVTAGGYRLAPGADTAGTIEDLMKVENDGIFYFGGHGGWGQNRNLDAVYGVTTATLVSLRNDSVYRALWMDSSIVYTLPITSGLRPFLTCQSPCIGYYAFTARFVEKHMKPFSDGSVVYIAACTSAEPGFRQAFIDKGAGVYFGWTGAFPADIDSRATSYLFDRLLGLNWPGGGPQESPPQRPFDYVSVHRDMGRASRGLTTSARATLGYWPGGTESGLLAPSIQYMDVEEESNTLVLKGKFGSERGEVSINGVSTNLLRVLNWTKEEIRVEIPVSGPHSAGDVVVWSKGRRSNTRRLSEWRPGFNLEFKADGTLKWEGEVRLHFRADVSSYREEAGDPPLYRTVPFQIARDTDGELEASGTYSIPFGSTTAWSGIARITNRMADPSAPNLVDGIGEVTTTSPFMRLALYVTAMKGMISTNDDGTEFDIPAVWGYGDGPLSVQKPLPALFIQLDREFGILGDFRRQSPIQPSTVMFWSSLKPNYIPADSLGR